MKLTTRKLFPGSGPKKKLLAINFFGYCCKQRAYERRGVFPPGSYAGQSIDELREKVNHLRRNS